MFLYPKKGIAQVQIKHGRSYCNRLMQFLRIMMPHILKITVLFHSPLLSLWPCPEASKWHPSNQASRLCRLRWEFHYAPWQKGRVGGISLSDCRAQLEVKQCCRRSTWLVHPWSLRRGGVTRVLLCSVLLWDPSERKRMVEDAGTTGTPIPCVLHITSFSNIRCPVWSLPGFTMQKMGFLGYLLQK